MTGTTAIRLRKGHALMLRTSDEERRSHGGFQWPEAGPVECDDWTPEPECGGGLHGLLWGEGDASLLATGDDAVWQLVDVPLTDVVDLGRKIKVPRGTVVYSGVKDEAITLLCGVAPIGSRVVYGTATAGDCGTATAGEHGSATAGDGGSLSILHWNGKRYRRVVASVQDEDGDGELLSNVAYKLDKDGKFVRVEAAS